MDYKSREELESNVAELRVWLDVAIQCIKLGAKHSTSESVSVVLNSATDKIKDFLDRTA